MVDNFELIKPLFYFNKANNMFFHCQIVQRAKDHKNNDIKVREGAIKTYYIRSREQLDALKEEIVILCEHYGARAYINVAGKDFNKLQSLMLVKLAAAIHEGNVQNPMRQLNSAAGALVSRSPRWIVDIDDVSMKDGIKETLCSLYSEALSIKDSKFTIDYIKEFINEYIVAEIPTKSGLHLIVKPFNLKKFHNKFPTVDVHKNSMGTMLYSPKSID